MKRPQTPPEQKDVFSSDRVSEFLKSQRNPKIVEFLRHAEAHYYPWDQLRFRAPPGLDPVLAWGYSIISRESRFKTLPLNGYGAIPLRFNVPDALQHELMLIDQQLAGGLTSDDDAVPAPSQRERFIISALREEAIASSMLEGAVTTRQEANQMLKTGRKPRSRGEQMVINNYRAIQFIRENRNTDLSPEMLLEIQKILTESTLDHPDQVGRFRTEPDNVEVVDGRDNEVMHRPPNAEELPQRLKLLCSFANRPPQEKEFIHPVIAACVLHFQLGFDHPFCDGNGRTARAIFYWMMLRRGYWLFEYLPISRLIYRAPAKYARSFLYCETDRFDITYFLMYKAMIIARARRDLKEYIADTQEQISQARQLVSSDKNLNHRQQEVILNATRSPTRYFTIAEHRNKFGLAYGTARSDLLQLVKQKYLKLVPVGRRFEFIGGEKLTRRK